MQDESVEELKQDIRDVFSWYQDLTNQADSFREIISFLENINFRNPDDLDKLYEYFPEDINKDDMEKIKQIMEEDDDEAVQAEESLKNVIQILLSGLQELRSALEI